MSNSASWAETFAPIESANRESVRRATFGHLAIVKNTTYKGEILFAVSEYNSNGYTVIKDTLPNSPWMFEAINEYVGSFDLEAGVYEIRVTVRNYKFCGKPVKVY